MKPTAFGDCFIREYNIYVQCNIYVHYEHVCMHVCSYVCMSLGFEEHVHTKT